MQSHHGKSSSVNLSAPVKHKTVQAVYPDGQNSIVKNLPIPTVSICNKAFYIPEREIIKHILAIGINIMFFHAGHEGDLLDEFHNDATGFLCNLPQNISTMNDVPRDTRVILVRV